MSARDYSHKRFTGKSIDASPPAPRVVTPTKSREDIPRNIMAAPTSPGSSYRSNSARSSADKLRAAHSLALQKTDSDKRLLSPTTSKKPSLSNLDASAYKIFLLLLQPQSKIFELIQLLYSPSKDTTIGDILQLIPSNATEPALGKQTYVGLCRPKTQEELLDLELLATSTRPGMESANISLGEILVAIPTGYTGHDVASLSKQILANPKIVKLLKRADPLAPKHRSKRKSSHRSRRTSSKVKSSEQVHVLEKHDESLEEDDHHHHMDKQEAERLMHMAMEHAAAEAAAANAAIPGGQLQKSKSISLIVRSPSISSENQSILEDFSTTQESLDDSYSSWSKSFDASFSVSSSICSGVSKRALRRKDRQAKRMRILQRSAMAAFGLMVIFYMMDPSRDLQVQEELSERTSRTPMGIVGIFQCMFLLLTLYKVERLVRTTHAAQHYHQHQNHNKGNMPTIYFSEERSCPFLKAAARAMKKFKNKYSKRLLRQQKQSVVASGTLQMSPPTSPTKAGGQKLRSFSLKGAAAGIHHLNDDDSGSL